MNTKKAYIRELDYIRAVSAVLIVLYHYTARYQESIGHVGAWPVSIAWGAWAVNVFFMLSGYLTLRNFREGGWRFLYKRFARLWPAFAVCVCLTSLCMWLLMPESLRSAGDILLNLTMIPSYLGAKPVDGVYWTLPLELLFYLWFMVLMTKSLRPHLLKCLYIWAVGMLLLSLIQQAGFEPLPVKLLDFLLISQRGECFLLGCIVALWQQKTESRRLIPLVLLCFLNSFISMGIGLGLWTLGFWLLIFMVVSGKLRFSSEKPGIVGRGFIWFSQISYPLYLLHQMIGFAIIRKLELAGCLSQWWIFMPIAVSVLMAAAVHYAVELPAAKLLLNLEKTITLRLKAGRQGK